MLDPDSLNRTEELIFKATAVACPICETLVTSIFMTGSFQNLSRLADLFGERGGSQFL